MKIGLSVYSFYEDLSCNKMSFDDFLKFAADARYSGVELADFIIPYDTDRVEYATILKKACDEVGLPVCGYIAIGDFFCEDLDAELARLKVEIDIAKILGSHVICIVFMDNFRRQYPTLEDCIDRAVDGLRILADYAGFNNIVLTIENTGRVFLDSIRVEQLIGRVGHDNFRIMADTGNLSDGDEDSAVAIGRIAHLVAHVHFKDYHVKDGSEFYPGEGWYVTRGGNYIRGAIVGHGNIPMMKCLKALKGTGYDGWLVVEFDGIEDPKYAAEMSLKNIEKMLKAYDFFVWTE